MKTTIKLSLIALMLALLGLEVDAGLIATAMGVTAGLAVIIMSVIAPLAREDFNDLERRERVNNRVMPHHVGRK